MNGIRSIAMLFQKDKKMLVTTMDTRSRLRFKKLINNYVPGGHVYTDAPRDKEFLFIPLEVLLNDIERYYGELHDTQAGEHIARNALRLTQGIRVQSDEEYGRKKGSI